MGDSHAGELEGVRFVVALSQLWILAFLDFVGVKICDQYQTIRRRNVM